MDATQIVGILASVFTGIALLPQLIKIIQEKKSGGTSPLMLGSLFIGLVFWVIYGFYKTDLIIIISNGFSLTVNSILCILSIRYHHKDKALAKFLIGKV
ncbi:hypothetical protein CNR22_18250 [Sphingobacteriaceae bacterium]|nr:hypothetical protein CNR22_18250 [Sphingobacteriaceae bacterium]